jgi:hypothetical protein
LKIADTQSALDDWLCCLLTPAHRYVPSLHPGIAESEVLAERLAERHAGTVFVADDLAAWLIGLLADAGRKKLITLVLGSEQERVLRSAATAAVQRTAEELCPGDEERAGQLALVVSQVFGESVAGEPLAVRTTVLEALKAGLAGQLAVLDDASLTGTGQSSADVLEVPGTVVAAKLTGYLIQEILVRGSRSGPLFPLASRQRLHRGSGQTAAARYRAAQGGGYFSAHPGGAGCPAGGCDGPG